MINCRAGFGPVPRTRSETIVWAITTYSVIIPVFNRAEKLKRTIESVRRLERPAGAVVEIVVVDDASSDASAAVARALGVEQLIVLEKNVGVTGARNRGIASSTGAFLIFLDSDDELLPDALLKIGAHFERWPATDILFGACVDRQRNRMHRANATIGPVNYQHLLVHSAPGEFLPVVRRAVFQVLSYEEQLRGFEGVTWLKAARHGFALHYSEEVLRVYDKDGADRLCRRENRLQGAQRLAAGWHFFLGEFGSDLWRLSRRAYLRAVLRWAVYERLQMESRPGWRGVPPMRERTARMLAVSMRWACGMVPRAIWVRCFVVR